MKFAPLIRVSTEKQKEKGESLRTQTDQIGQYVKSLGGEIPDNCWQYAGQEHATPEYERQLLEKLLRDSANGKFDAVIVADTSRWSRDNQKSKEGLEVLRSHGIRFFVGTMEYDLYNPEHSFILGMSAEIGEFQARQQALKSITNRINRAKRNIPTSGKLPYGRIFDPEKGWGLDPEKVGIIKTAAKRYLDGMPLPEVGRLAGMNFTNLWKILNHRSGTEWEVRFRSTTLNIDETLVLTIPRLLDDKIIQAIKERAAANKTYTHGEVKYRYLLSRMIFCQKCGYTLLGQTNMSGKKYYRHPRYRKHPCKFKNWVPADKIGDAVLTVIFQMFGDQERIEAAIRKAIPDLDKVQAMLDELEDLKKQKAETIQERNELVKLAGKGLFTDEEITERITPIREKLKTIEDRISWIEPQLIDQPTPAEIRKKSKLALAVVADALKHPGPKAIEKLMKGPYERKRKVLERAFAGKDREGNRLGVYVTQTGDIDRPFKFEIRATLDQVVELFEDKGVKGSCAWR